MTKIAIVGAGTHWDFIHPKEALIYSDFVAIRRCSPKIPPYISFICGVDIFYSRLVSPCPLFGIRTRNKLELP